MKKAAKKSSKKTPTKKEQMIVFVDGAGNYYEIPREVFEKSRVSGSRKAKIKEALDDVLEEAGYINAPLIPGSIVSSPVSRNQALHFAGFYLKSAESKD